MGSVICAGVEFVDTVAFCAEERTHESVLRLCNGAALMTLLLYSFIVSFVLGCLAPAPEKSSVHCGEDAIICGLGGSEVGERGSGISSGVGSFLIGTISTIGEVLDLTN